MKTNVANTPPLVGSVLHPTDFSDASHRAFAHALVIALLRQTDFTILHVGPETASGIDWASFPPVRKTLERWGLLEEDSPQSAVFEQFRVRVKKASVRSRHPVLATANYLSNDPVDLIVLATEGREGASRWLNRSDAEAMARWSKTMTLFVPASARRGLVSLEDGDLNLRNILVPVDSEPSPTTALVFAKRAAEILGDEGVTITAMHIGDERPATPALDDGPHWSWQWDQQLGDPVEQILAGAERHRADLIVMPTAGHDSVLDALRGSTTEQVLRQAPCPLLAVPAG